MKKYLVIVLCCLCMVGFEVQLYATIEVIKGQCDAELEVKTELGVKAESGLKKGDPVRKKEKISSRVLDGGSDPIWVRSLDHYFQFRKKYLKDHAFLHMLAQGQNPELMVVACCDSRVDPALILQAYLGDLFVIRNVANIVPVYSRNNCYQGTGAALEYGVKALKVKHLVILGHSQCGGVRGALEGVGIPNDFITRWVSQIQNIRNGHLIGDGEDIIESVEDSGHAEDAGIDSSIVADMFARIIASNNYVNSDISDVNVNGDIIDNNVTGDANIVNTALQRAGGGQALPNDYVDAYAKEALCLSYRNSMGYPWIRDAVVRGELIIHLWFFDIKKALLSIYSPEKQQFVPLSDKALAAFLASHRNDLA